MKKNVWVALFNLVLIAAFALSACAQPTAAPVAQPTAAPAQPTAAPAQPAAKAELTIWHAYGTGGSEEKALTQILDAYKAANPDVTLNVLQIPFDQVFNKWETEVAAGGGPDMFTAPNDSLGKEVRAGLVADITANMAGKTDGIAPIALGGLTVDGKLYGVPGIIKAVALYYNKSTIPTPPATTADLLALVKSGKKLVINQSAYHNFGFFLANGSAPWNDKGECVNTQPVADTYQYLVDLKALDANIFQTDGGKINTMFMQGDADMTINGPWALGDYKAKLGDNLGVAPMPSGANPAGPLTGIDGWYVNPNSKNVDAAIALALYITNKDGQKIYADVAGDPPIRTDVSTADPLVKAFSDAANTGYLRPQAAYLDNFWGPFGDDLTKAVEGKLSPVDAAVEACTAMNKGNKIDATVPAPKAGGAAPVVAPAGGKKLKIGLVSDQGGVNDKSFNQGAWEGVQKAAKEFGFEAQYVESKQPTDYEKNIDQFATEGYDVIVTVGFMMGDATAAKAKQYPNIKFAIVDNAYFPTKGSAACADTVKDCYADGGLTNVTSLMFQEDEVGFLAGVVAAGMSKTGTICTVSGMEIPPVVRYVTGYQAGAKWFKPATKALNVYIPSFIDPAKGKENGQAMIGQGCDVLFGVGGNTGNGGLLAAKEKGLMAIGVDVDQYNTYPEVKDALVTSAQKNVDAAVYEYLKSANAGAAKAGVVTANLKNGGVGLAPYHDWDSKVPADVKAKVQEAIDGLKAGTLTVTGEAAAPAGGKKLKIGLVSDQGGVNDKSFNQGAWEGVQKAAKEFGWEAQYVESKQPTDYEKNIDQFATEGYNVIVTVGFMMGDATAAKAKQYPDIKFAIVDNAYFPTKGSAACADTVKDCYADGGLTKVTSLMFQEDEVGFLAGVVAGGITKSNTVCTVSGMEIPPVVRYVVGYQNGAKWINPKAKSLNVYIPSFIDPAKGKENGQAMIGQGCDVLFGVGGNTGNGGLLAAKEKGLAAIGVDVDQYNTYPEVKDALVTSAQKNVDVAVYEYLKAVNGGTDKAGVITANIKNGGVGLAPYHDWESKVPDTVKAKVQEAIDGLKNGTIVTGYKP